MKATLTDSVWRGKPRPRVEVTCETAAEWTAIQAAAKDSGMTVSKWLYHVIVSQVSGIISKHAKAVNA